MERISDKSRGGLLIITILLGMFGIHRIYVGKIGTGVIMLLMTLSGFCAVISFAFVVIDIIAISCGLFRDSKGAEIKNW